MTTFGRLRCGLALCIALSTLVSACAGEPEAAPVPQPGPATLEAPAAEAATAKAPIAEVGPSDTVGSNPQDAATAVPSDGLARPQAGTESQESASSANQAPPPTSTATPAANPIPTPLAPGRATPRPTTAAGRATAPATEQPAGARLPQELVFFALGGGDAPCFFDDGRPRPAIFGGAQQEGMSERTGVVCIWGMPGGQPIRLKLVSPDGHYSFAATFQVNSAGDIRGTTPPGIVQSVLADDPKDGKVGAIFVIVWWPAEMPAGAWSATAQAGDAVARGTFDVGTAARREIMAGVSAADREPQPGQQPRTRACHYLPAYRADAAIAVSGVNFPPNTMVTVGLYRYRGGAAGSLVASVGVRTDGKGRLGASLRPAALPAGNMYGVVALVDLAVEVQADGTVDTALAPSDCFITGSPPAGNPVGPAAQASKTPTTAASAGGATCKSIYKTRLQPGMAAIVAPGLPNRVRSQPGRGARVIGSIEAGQRVDILLGPSCDGDWIWWYVRVAGSGVEGWTSEGDSSGYWLVPAITPLPTLVLPRTPLLRATVLAPVTPKPGTVTRVP